MHRSEEELADITQVLSHRFKSSKKTLNNLELLLVWEDDPKPTWFPWNSSFRSIDVIHRYFENNQMRKFIPPEFTWGKDHPDYTPHISTDDLHMYGKILNFVISS